MTPDHTDPARRDGAAEAMARDREAAMVLVHDLATRGWVTRSDYGDAERVVATAFATLLTTVRAQARAEALRECAVIADAAGRRELDRWPLMRNAAGSFNCGSCEFHLTGLLTDHAEDCPVRTAGEIAASILALPTDAPGGDGPDGRRRG